MTRAISSLCLLVVLLAGGSALAQKKKDKIAILGLEVWTGSAAVDTESTRVAQDLTVDLRLRPKAGQGPYLFTPNSEKELIDEKLMNNCDNEGRDCMAKIGERLGADMLLYGRIEKKSQGGTAGYQISLKLLGVKSGTFNTWTEFIPIVDTKDPAKLGDWARRGYKYLTNENEGGTLVINVKNVERGTILIDGEERGNIVNNTGTVTGLAEGRYKVAVVATGYRRWTADEAITIKNGQTHSEDVVLQELKPGDPPLCDPAVSTCENTSSHTGPSGFWKGLMITGIVVAVAGGAGAVGTYLVADGFKKDLEDIPDDNGGPLTVKRQHKTDKGEQWTLYTNISFGIIAAGGLAALLGGFKAYSHDSEKPAAGNPTVGRRNKGTGVVVVPVITPDGGAGATLHWRW